MEKEGSFFSFTGFKGDLALEFYNMLTNEKLGQEVSYKDFINSFEKKCGEKPSEMVSASTYYNHAKQVVRAVINEMEFYGYHIETIAKGRETSYRYKGQQRDPLYKSRRKQDLKAIKENLDHKFPVKVTYRPFDKGPRTLLFHPHHTLEYNNRLFAIGVSEREGKQPMRRCILGLDRIVEYKAHYGKALIEEEPNEYEYLKHLVGVTLETNAKLQYITLKTHDRYTFGRLLSKPMHFSQRVTHWWKSKENGGDGYGEFTIEVYPNKELIGQILSYGNLLEVMSPEDFRKRVSDELTSMLRRYTPLVTAKNNQ